MQHIVSLFLLALFLTHNVARSSDEYTYKVKNLKPRDYGIEAKTWERALSTLNNRLDESQSDTEALYLRAITRREMGIRKALLLRTLDWKKSTEDFERVIESDSSYRDVLYQYGLLKQYKKDFDQAFQLMQRQQAVTERRGYVEASIFRLYRYFFREHPPAEIEQWFSEYPSAYGAYFHAEERRREGRFEEADRMFSAQLLDDLAIPVQPILLSRARIYYALGQPKIAQSYVNQAIDTIVDEVSARMFFEDFKYILSDVEIERYTKISQPEAFQQFFSNVLEKRNPTRADEVDLRLQVHYERLIEAEKIYTQYEPREAFRVIKSTDSYQTADRDFPRAYWLNGELGDRGLIFMRHGKPNDITGSVTEETTFIESWRYLNPELVFHFEGHAGLGVLIPTLPNVLSVVEAREIWGGGYALLSQSLRRRDNGLSNDRHYELDIINYTNELFDQGIEDVGKGLTTDRYVWPGDLKHINVPYLVSAFRTDQDQTLVEIHFAIPIGEALEEVDTIPGQMSMDVGFAVHDTMWNALHKQLESRAVALENYTRDDSAIDVIRFIAPPDSFQVNLHVGLDEVRRKGSYLFGYRVPDFTGKSLLISDIVPALKVTESESANRYTRNGLEVYANPGRGFQRERALAVYYEVYNLTYGANDRTAYTIRYTLEERKKGRRIFKRKPEMALSVSVEREGGDRTAIEYGELDVSALKKGAYDLRVTVTDTHTGQQVSAYREIELR